MAGQTVTAELYAEVQHFYARQMQALDNRVFKAYADSFTEDGTFQHTPGTEPARTRAGIKAELECFHEQYQGDPVQKRHYFNQIVLDANPDGTLTSTVYALVLRTRPGADRPEVWPSCVVHDVLVRGADGILIESRHIDYDQQI
ncbi:nuclear transport factor 2 family protein [Streptomyces sp. NPDC051162]|uniref:nuclear transport factor 2 family protein n=1 Tax=Streptomyces sp. NPDC051162 TaxID=3154747 RepID=UPI00344166D0